MSSVYMDEDGKPCSLCDGQGMPMPCSQCGKQKVNPMVMEIDRLRAIIDRRNAKLREWRERAEGYDNVAIGTVVGMMVDEMLKEDA